VRYRFYVSSAILTGRRDEAGSVTRISAPDLESRIVSALRERFADSSYANDQDLIGAKIERIILDQSKFLITLKTSDATGNQIELARPRSMTSTCARIETDSCQTTGESDISLIHALARAHLWLTALSDGVYQSIEELAGAVKWNPKVIRKALRLAFLTPDITEAILLGSHPKPLSVSELQGTSVFSWNEQRHSLNFLDIQ
jgi:site-specific DNA recombinase